MIKISSVETLLKYARSWIGLNEKDGSYKQIIDVYNNHLPRARSYKVKYKEMFDINSMNDLKTGDAITFEKKGENN